MVISRRRPKDIGTAAETAAVKVLRTRGWPSAERRSLRGANDAGDITGTPGVAWSVKGGDMARDASDKQIILWLDELDQQIANAQATVGVLIIQRRGVGKANAHHWWAVMRTWRFFSLADPSGWSLQWNGSVRMLLGDMCEVLTAAGYGTPEGKAAA